MTNSYSVQAGLIWAGAWGAIALMAVWTDSSQFVWNNPDELRHYIVGAAIVVGFIFGFMPNVIALLRTLPFMALLLPYVGVHVLAEKMGITDESPFVLTLIVTLAGWAASIGVVLLLVGIFKGWEHVL